MKNGIVVGRFSGIVVAGLAFVVFWTDTGGTMGCCEGFTEELVFIGSVVESGVDKVVVFPTPPGCSIGTLVTGRIRDSFRVVVKDDVGE